MNISLSKIRNFALLFCILSLCFCVSCGSVPNLESPECTAARDTAKRFYSFHFGNDMHPTPENLKAREQYLTPRFFAQLNGNGDTKHDPFTMTSEFPKAFRTAECKANSADNVDVKIQLYWHTDEKSVQQEVRTNFVKQGDKWLLDGVGSKGD